MTERMPRLPQGQSTTADMGLSILDLAHDPDLKEWANVLVKTDCPLSLQQLYLNCLNVGLYLIKHGYPQWGQVRLNRVATALQMRPSADSKRIKQLLDPIQLELHRDQHKTEEKPRI